MVDLVLMAVKSISNGSGRCEVRDIIHEKVSKSVHKNRIANFILFEQTCKFSMSILISTLYSLEKVNIIIHMQFCFTYNLRNSQIVLGQVYALSGILY